MTFAEVNQEMGNSLIDKGCSPQGNDSYLYNPGGEYSSLIEVQFRNDTVVEKSTISGDFDYEGTVKAKDSISDLTNNGFTEMGTYKYTIYNKTGDKEHINVMVDHPKRDSKVYGIQIFDRSLGELKKLLLPENCSYTGDVNKYQGRLEAHYLNAYRAYHKCDLKCELMTITNEGVAQTQSEYMEKCGSETSSDSQGRTWKTRFDDEYDLDGVGFTSRLEYNSLGSPDAFSAVTYAIATRGPVEGKRTFYDYSLGKHKDLIDCDMNIECGFAAGYVVFDFYSFQW